jgi:hypothetical protein
VSFQGTLGPFVKGASTKLILRALVVAIFSAAFVLGAVLIFGVASLTGALLNVASLPVPVRFGILISLLTGLAVVDLFSIRKKRFCVLGWRRQTPKTLNRKYRMTTVAAIWGFDTGLAVTTFRVGAITWGALVTAGLGFAPWWIGFGYGMAFVLPLVALLLLPDADPRTDRPRSLYLRLETLTAKRPVIQLGSAAILFLTTIILCLRLYN